MQVQVLDYQPHWPTKFQTEALLWREILGQVLVDIQHIGSTSVPSLAAKPIIDILLAVSDLKTLDSYTSEIEKRGYEVMGEYHIPGRRYFRKGGNQRSHHVHAFQIGDANLVRHLAFRDYLRAHPAVAKAYGDLKKEIIQHRIQDSISYGDAKEPFIKEHEEKASAWYRQQ
ncbi:MAG: GrpB family protein [Bacteroidota bacterium]